VRELVQAGLIFGLGAIVTLATVVMILKGHLYWLGQEGQR
jgi:hypothetical protein